MFLLALPNNKYFPSKYAKVKCARTNDEEGERERDAKRNREKE